MTLRFWPSLVFVLPMLIVFEVGTWLQLRSGGGEPSPLVAFYLIAVNFLSYTFAPSLPPAMDLLIFGKESTLGTSISVLAVINYSIAAVCLGLALKHYRRALDAAKAWTQ